MIILQIIKKNISKILLILLFFSISMKNLNGSENRIIFKINENAYTLFDLEKRIEYLDFVGNNNDINQNIKSTAVYFGEKGQRFVTICYTLVLIIFGFLGWNSSNSLFSLFIIAILGICTYIAIQKWDMHSKESSNFYFR